MPVIINGTADAGLQKGTGIRSDSNTTLIYNSSGSYTT